MLHTNSLTKSRPRIKLSFELVALILYVTVIGYTVARCLLDHNNYIKGNQAYLKNDCSIAVSHFDNIRKGWRFADFYKYATLAERKRTECLDRIAKKLSPTGSKTIIGKMVTNYSN